jgi:hypothetical protein
LGCSIRISRIVRPSNLGERGGVQRRALVGVGDAFVGLGGHDPLVRDDLAVLAVEADLETVLRHHRVAPLATLAKVDLAGGHLAAVRVPPPLD